MWGSALLISPVLKQGATTVNVDYFSFYYASLSALLWYASLPFHCHDCSTKMIVMLEKQPGHLMLREIKLVEIYILKLFSIVLRRTSLLRFGMISTLEP